MASPLRYHILRLYLLDTRRGASLVHKLTGIWAECWMAGGWVSVSYNLCGLGHNSDVCMYRC